MQRKFPGFLAAFLAFLTVGVIGLWIRSYFVVDSLEYVYYQSRGTLVEGDSVIKVGLPKAVSVSSVGGSIVIDRPYYNGNPYGWNHLTVAYATIANELALHPHLGFSSQPNTAVVPIWLLAYGLATIPALFFWRGFRKRDPVGFEVK